MIVPITTQSPALAHTAMTVAHAVTTIVAQVAANGGSLLTVGVAGGTFALLMVPEVRGVSLNRAVTSAVGAVVLVAIGAESAKRALGSVDVTTLLLLFGMMVHVECFGNSGVYEWAAGRLTRSLHSTRQLALGALGLSAVLSAIALNDATVILLTPVLVGVTRRAEVDPVAPLVALVLGANIGSLATPLGNPQNAYILSRSGLSTARFVARLAPIALGSLLLAAVAVAIVAPTARLAASTDVPSLDRRSALVGGGFLVGTFALLLALPGADPGMIAASTAVFHLGVVQLRHRESVDDVLHRVDWQLLVMFVGLFVITGALSQTVLSTLLGRVSTGLPLAGVTFVLSNAVSNVPAVLLLSPVVSGHANWVLLAAVSTLAGNATPVASAATLIVLERARRRDVDVSLRRFVIVGLPVAVVTSAVAVVALVGV